MATPECLDHSSLSYFSLFNIQGLKPSTRPSCVPYVKDLLKANNQLFICLTETWLYQHLDAELDIEGYSLFHADRDISKRHAARKLSGRCSGGVACYVEDCFAGTLEQLLSFSNGVIECLILYSRTSNLMIISLYRQPDDKPSGNR